MILKILPCMCVKFLCAIQLLNNVSSLDFKDSTRMGKEQKQTCGISLEFAN